MEEQKSLTIKGGTMRLGAYDCALGEGTLARKIYGKELISERHRHRYEFNDTYRKQFEEAGMKISGQNPGSGLAEIIELPEHPFFIATQFHPPHWSVYGINFVAMAKALRGEKEEEAVDLGAED